MLSLLRFFTCIYLYLNCLARTARANRTDNKVTAEQTLNAVADFRTSDFNNLPYLNAENSECDYTQRTSCKEKEKVCAEVLIDINNRTYLSGKCVVPIDECQNSTLNNCDPSAHCIDNDFSYECLCPAGYIDTSPTPAIRPGRKCQKCKVFSNHNFCGLK